MNVAKMRILSWMLEKHRVRYMMRKECVSKKLEVASIEDNEGNRLRWFEFGHV